VLAHTARASGVGIALAGVWFIWPLVVFFSTATRLTAYPDPKHWTVAGLLVTAPVVATYVTPVIWLAVSRRWSAWPRLLAINYVLLLIPLVVLAIHPNAAWFPTGNGPELILNWPGRLIGA
jgi:hypothetical protein